MTYWAIAKGDKCIYMAADVRVSTAEGEYSDSVCKIWTAQYEDKQNRPIRIGICVSGHARFPMANQTQWIEILTALDEYLKNRVQQRFSFQSGEAVIENFFPFIGKKYGSESLHYIATNNLFGVGIAIGDALEIAGFDGNEIRSFPDYLEMAMLYQEAKLNIDSRFGDMLTSLKSRVPAEKFKYLVSMSESSIGSLYNERLALPRPASLLKQIIFVDRNAPAYVLEEKSGKKLNNNNQATVSENCDIVSISKQKKGIVSLQTAPKSQNTRAPLTQCVDATSVTLNNPQQPIDRPYNPHFLSVSNSFSQPKSNTASSVTLAPHASFHATQSGDDKQKEQRKNDKRSHGAPKCNVC